MTPEFDRRAELGVRREETEGPFKALCQRFLSLSGWASGPTAKRFSEALWALRRFRDARNQDRDMGGGEVILAVRVIADELARQIQAKAGPEQDPATIAWVVAGMQCPAQPFCTGCTTCATIMSPGRLIPGQVGVR
jgi:hypothetical protein